MLCSLWLSAAALLASNALAQTQQPATPWQTCQEIEGNGGECGAPDNPHPFDDYLKLLPLLKSVDEGFARHMEYALYSDGKAAFRSEWHELGRLNNIRIRDVRFFANDRSFAYFILAEKSRGRYVPLLRYSGPIESASIEGTGPTSVLTSRKNWYPETQVWTWRWTPTGPIVEQSMENLRGPRPTIPPPEESESGSVRGRVVDAETGMPVAGARFNVGMWNEGVAVTGADGTFEVRRLAERESYNFWVRKAGYANLSKVLAFSIHAGEVTSLGDLALPRPATITGHVLDEQGTPLPWISVDLLHHDGFATRSAVSDLHGAFTLFDVDPGRYTLRAGGGRAAPLLVQRTDADGKIHWQGYRWAESFWKKDGAAQATEFDVAPRADLSGFEIRLAWTAINVPAPALPPGTASLRVKITDRKTGLGLSRAAVVYWLPNSTEVDLASDEHGLVSISGIAEGNYPISVRRQGYIPASTRGDVLIEPLVAHAGPATAAPLVVQLMPEAVIEGRLNNRIQLAGQPPGRFEYDGISAGQVVLMQRQLDWSGEIAWSDRTNLSPDSLGRFWAYELGEGEYTIRYTGREQMVDAMSPRQGVPIQAKDYGQAPVYLGGAADIDHALVLKLRAGEVTTAPQLDFGGLPVFRLAGVVKDRKNGRPLPGATLLLRPTVPYDVAEAVRAKTGDDGRFAFDGLCNGAYSLVLDRSVQQRFDFSVHDSDLTGQEVLADEEMPLAIDLVCANCSAASLANARVGLIQDLQLKWPIPNIGSSFPASMPSARIQSNRATLPAILPGRYRMSIDDVQGYFIVGVLENGREIWDGTIAMIGLTGRVRVTVQKANGQISGTLPCDDPIHCSVFYQLADAPKTSWTAVHAALDGTYVIPFLLPGKYRIRAVHYPEYPRPSEPAWWRQSKRETLVDVGHRPVTGVRLDLITPSNYRD